MEKSPIKPTLRQLALLPMATVLAFSLIYVSPSYGEHTSHEVWKHRKEQQREAWKHKQEQEREAHKHRHEQEREARKYQQERERETRKHAEEHEREVRKHRKHRHKQANKNDDRHDHGKHYGQYKHANARHDHGNHDGHKHEDRGYEHQISDSNSATKVDLPSYPTITKPEICVKGLCLGAK